MSTKSPRIKAKTIATRSEFERVVDDISRSSVQLRKLEAARDRKLQEVRSEWDGAIAREQERIESLTLMAENFAETNRGELLPSKAKSGETPLAYYGFRLGNTTLKLLSRAWSWEKVLEELGAKNLTQFIRVKREPDKEGLKQHLDAEQLAAVGCRVDQAETFFIEPKERASDAVAA